MEAETWEVSWGVAHSPVGKRVFASSFGINIIRTWGFIA